MKLRFQHCIDRRTQTGPLYYNKDKDGEYGSISDLPALTVTRNGTECIFINDNIKNGDVYKVGVNGDVYKVGVNGDVYKV